MKKGLVIGACFLFILIVLMSFATAGFFSDLFKAKITGETIYGDCLLDNPRDFEGNRILVSEHYFGTGNYENYAGKYCEIVWGCTGFKDVTITDDNVKACRCDIESSFGCNGESCVNDVSSNSYWERVVSVTCTGCPTACDGSATPVCGDGTINPGEECDDGNTINGDGCSSNCVIEIETPVECVPACEDTYVCVGGECVQQVGIPKNEVGCIDRDVTAKYSDGKNYYVNTSATGNTFAGGTHTVNDGCIEGGDYDGWLREAICDGEIATWVDYNCLNGCIDGACVGEDNPTQKSYCEGDEESADCVLYEGETLLLGDEYPISIGFINHEEIRLIFNGENLDSLLSEGDYYDVLKDGEGKYMQLFIKEIDYNSREIYVNKVYIDIQVLDEEPVEVLSPEDCTTGCYLDEKCYAIGYVKRKTYCADDLTWGDQQDEKEVCAQNFECKNNICLGGACVELSTWQKILKWLGFDLTPTAECTDTDPLDDDVLGTYPYGKNIYESGATTIGNNDMPDTCYDTSQVVENYCIDEKTGDAEVIACPSGFVCDLGACVESINETIDGCTDTDRTNEYKDGKNYYKKGQTNDTLNMIFTDGCQMNLFDALTEHYCDEGKRRATSYDCLDERMFCYDAACKEGELMCNDTDDGEDYFKKGKVISFINLSNSGEIVHKREYFDGCVNATQLFEYFCEGFDKEEIRYYVDTPGMGGIYEYYPRATGRYVDCPNGCYEGACVEEETGNCIDDDGGIDYYVQGIANDEVNSFEDICIVAQSYGDDDLGAIVMGKYNSVVDCTGLNCFLFEAVCENQIARGIYYICPYGCKEGECVVEEPISEPPVIVDYI